MTRPRTEELECPSCGMKKNVILYDSINVTVDPNLREKLFNGEVNVLNCDKCGDSAFFAAPFLYHDMERKFMVQFVPFAYVEEKVFLQNFTKDGKLLHVVAMRFPRSFRQMCKNLQIVFDIEELMRYVIFREKLYDMWKEAS